MSTETEAPVINAILTLINNRKDRGILWLEKTALDGSVIDKLTEMGYSIEIMFNDFNEPTTIISW